MTILSLTAYPETEDIFRKTYHLAHTWHVQLAGIIEEAYQVALNDVMGFLRTPKMKKIFKLPQDCLWDLEIRRGVDDKSVEN